MNTQPIDTARDADLRLSLAALRRAAQRAHDLARQTGTAIVISRQGVIQTIRPGAQETAGALPTQEPLPPFGNKP